MKFFICILFLFYSLLVSSQNLASFKKNSMYLSGQYDLLVVMGNSIEKRTIRINKLKNHIQELSVTIETIINENENTRLKIRNLENKLNILTNKSKIKKYLYCPNNKSYNECNHVNLKNRHDNEVLDLSTQIRLLKDKIGAIKYNEDANLAFFNKLVSDYRFKKGILLFDIRSYNRIKKEILEKVKIQLENYMSIVNN